MKNSGPTENSGPMKNSGLRPYLIPESKANSSTSNTNTNTHSDHELVLSNPPSYNMATDVVNDHVVNDHVVNDQPRASEPKRYKRQPQSANRGLPIDSFCDCGIGSCSFNPLCKFGFEIGETSTCCCLRFRVYLIVKIILIIAVLIAFIFALFVAALSLWKWARGFLA